MDIQQLISYLKNVEEIYLYLADNNKNWKIINCVDKNKPLSIEQVSDKIFLKVKNYLE